VLTQVFKPACLAISSALIIEITSENINKLSFENDMSQVTVFPNCIDFSCFTYNKICTTAKMTIQI